MILPILIHGAMRLWRMSRQKKQAPVPFTIYDMCKALDRAMVIGEVRLLEKSGGKSGHFKRDESSPCRSLC